MRCTKSFAPTLIGREPLKDSCQMTRAIVARHFFSIVWCRCKLSLLLICFLYHFESVKFLCGQFESKLGSKRNRPEGLITDTLILHAANCSLWFRTGTFRILIRRSKFVRKLKFTYLPEEISQIYPLCKTHCLHYWRVKWSPWTITANVAVYLVVNLLRIEYCVPTFKKYPQILDHETMLVQPLSARMQVSASCNRWGSKD